MKNKICLVIPSLHAGGMERVMSVLINEFSKKSNLEIHLVMYGIKPEIFYELPDNVNIHTPIFVFNNNRRFYYTLKTIAFLRLTISKIKPTTILSFGEFWNSFVLIALLGLKFPIFVSDRCQPNKSLGKFHNFLRKFLYPRATGIIAQTKIAKEIYSKEYHHNNITVIGNPIKIYKEEENLKKEKIVLSVGRLIKSKHHDELIRLFTQINKPDWKLVIVGNDALKQKNMNRLKALIKELNAEQQIILAGEQNDVNSYYKKSKIFAFTSSSEGFPNVIGEAQSAGLPVIAFDCIAGPADLIQNNENGYLIPLFDFNMFKDKLMEMMDNENLREKMGANAKTSVKDFNSDKIAEQFYQFISKV
jgi:GalNAc-alpha-(1->4)-GalNAc-alpha-(1->3)-diNAcBac-PP-undecaprenol alpha-1,4-N-acetyl-D-galactosaminyltransferase